MDWIRSHRLISAAFVTAAGWFHLYLLNEFPIIGGGADEPIWAQTLAAAVVFVVLYIGIRRVLGPVDGNDENAE